MELIYKIKLIKEEEGGFMVIVPQLPGCITQGDTEEDAIEMAEEAIELYLEEMQNQKADRK